MAKGRFFLGMLAGLAAGAIVGILFAPDKGASTRKKIVDKGADIIDKGEGYVDNLKEKINSLLHNGKKNDKVKESASAAR
jgi:gas vesicle protein